MLHQRAQPQIQQEGTDIRARGAGGVEMEKKGAHNPKGEGRSGVIDAALRARGAGALRAAARLL